MNDTPTRSVTARPPGHDALRWRDLARTRSVLIVLLVVSIVAAIVVYGLWALRRQTLDGELRMLASLSAAMAAQADGTLGVAEAVLRATRAELVDGLLPPGTETAHALLRSRVTALPKFKVLAVIDAHGMRLATSRNDPRPPRSVADLDFFVAARRDGGDDLFVGSPYISRSDGQPAIGVSMGWRGKAGDFKGALVLTADPEFLDGGFEGIAPTPDTNLAIYRRDRELVSDGPGDGIDRLLPASAMDALWADPAPETPRLVDLPDGRQRLVAAHRLQRDALMVVVTRDAGAALADWTEQAWLVGSFAASALAVTLLLSLRNAREQALRHASEAALSAEQARAVRAFQAAREGHWEWDPRTRRSHLSPRMKELLGIARDAPLDGEHGLLELGAVHPQDSAALREAFAAHQAERSARFDHRFRVRDAGGQWRHVRARGQALRDAAGEAVLFSGTALDVTDEVLAQQHKQQLEDQLQRARKLEALGTLAGGVAHDFNNILAAVVGYGELARGAAAEGSAQARQIDQVLQAGQRGKALVGRILSFSPGAPRAHVNFALQPVIEEVLQMLAGSLPRGVRLQSRLRAPQATVSGDPTMVYEAAMNLCTNAIQAVEPQGGAIVVALDEVEPAQPLPLFESVLAAGHYVCLSVSDDGCGIAPAAMTRLFEPFFTTKDPQQGTGLGLAVAHGVMTDLHGAIDVQSEVGRGSRFGLYFPRVGENLPVTPDADDACPRGAGETVLVVDDEATLVELAEELLADLGYEPVGFASATQALAAFKAEPERFDLVLTDELMPVLSGTALAEALHALRPVLPIMLVSGYGGPQLQARAGAAGIAEVLGKPLARTELARALARALGATGRATVTHET